jgi:hypothetical protein
MTTRYRVVSDWSSFQGRVGEVAGHGEFNDVPYVLLRFDDDSRAFRFDMTEVEAVTSVLSAPFLSQKE